MQPGNGLRVCLIVLLGMLTAACSAPAATPEPDRIATRVAEELAVSQTLTAVLATANAPTLKAGVSTQAPRLPASPNAPATVASQVNPPTQPAPTRTLVTCSRF